ncbi:MAG: acyl-CoA dehydrogenase family protein [Steroidobacteraceae bacterium]
MRVVRGNTTDGRQSESSISARALAAAGNEEAAREVGALESAVGAVASKLASGRSSLVGRLIYGPRPGNDELQAGGRACAEFDQVAHPALTAALRSLAAGSAFSADGKLSEALRQTVAQAGAYGLTVPTEYGGCGQSYLQLAHLEEALTANGLGPLAVEISGELTIGAGSLLGYGDEAQRRTYLPMIAEGKLMGFALTEVGTGVNAKKIQAYVEPDEHGNYRLFADDARNKLWITNAAFGSLVGVVARIGKGGPDLGLFIVQLPMHNVDGSDAGWEFRCEPSDVAAFTANHNSRLHFRNFPIPAANRVQGDGVEILFYCLRLGRCMLAAMSGGYQRMLAVDASRFARERPGVGGLVINHELPQLAIARMLGGSLQARSLAFLSLAQDAAGVDLAGLRDLTKSAAAQTGVESMMACEHVLGGRSFAQHSRVNAARANLHLFGVVEGEDDLIRMGAVKDVTLPFVDRYLSPLLDVLRRANTDAGGKTVASEERILRLGMREFLRFPRRSLVALGRLLVAPGLLPLGGWICGNAALDLARAASRVIPSGWLRAYRSLPPALRGHVRLAEWELRQARWTYLRLSLSFQLQLTSAQVALQRLGQRLEWLVSILALCHHSAVQDPSQQRIADLQCLLLRERVHASRRGLSSATLRRLQRALSRVARDVRGDEGGLFSRLPAEPYAHPWK